MTLACTAKPSRFSSIGRGYDAKTMCALLSYIALLVISLILFVFARPFPLQIFVLLDNDLIVKFYIWSAISNGKSS